MTATAQNAIHNAAYSQLIALRDSGTRAESAITMVAETLVEEFSCSLRRATFIAVTAWTDLDRAATAGAYVDTTCTSGNMVVIQDPSTGRTSIFSVRELLALREQATKHYLNA
ncbi:hypothetical protein [Marinobacter oulmenensis]|uniref:Uncharacterized protein n=1 Tax=Marinobacter oulmenensis TaxID=643747 RepID=A0A840U5P0_9GAMM|nr:hypothetical protein [Marinobacter oulmenensis]MBB5320449.1 hypothetical protein [Marinobacter oulmenensis]